MSEWFFSRQRPADKDRQPMQGEFFSTASIESVADSLVREFIQNSLDAAADRSVPVTVRIRIGSIPKNDPVLDTLFDGLWPHVAATDRSRRGVRRRNCRYLLIEDLATTGLRGDPDQMFEPIAERETGSDDSPPNEFFYFVRAEGKSSKSSAERGSWGIGKYTFPMASDVNTFFALTCREDPRQPGGRGPLLLGQSILKHHLVGSTQYKPDGWWCRIERDGNGDELPIPFSGDDPELPAFIEAFNVSRDMEPGLSIAIPYVSKELTEDELVSSVLRNYGVAIRLGSLVVEVSVDGELLVIDSSAVAAVAEASGTSAAATAQSGDRLAERCSTQVIDELKLASWWVDQGSGSAVELPTPEIGEQTKWPGRVPDDIRSDLRSRLDGTDPVAVRIPIHIREKDGSAADWAHLDVVFSSTEGETSRPVFYREGIRVAEIESSRIVGLQAMVLIQDRLLAEFLGAAEGPAHVDWQAGRERFKGRFAQGKNLLSFVKQSPSGLIRQVRSDTGEEDFSIAAPFFSLPAAKEAPPTRPTGTTRVTPPPPTPPPLPKPIRLTSQSGGFVVHGTDLLEVGQQVRIRAAYDIRRGDPLRKWTADDFVLSANNVEVTGANSFRAEGNEVRVVVTDPERFEVRGSGLDVRRDVLVRVEVTT